MNYNKVLLDYMDKCCYDEPIFIEDIKIGDYVLTHNNKYEQVLDTIITKSNDLYEIKITHLCCIGYVIAECCSAS